MKRRIVAALGILLAGCADNAGNAVDEVPAAESNGATASSPEMNSPGTSQAAATNNTARTKAGACLMQDGEALRITPVKAIGTEPFWAAQVEGRCVTYSTPEDQKGTRIWSRFNPGPDGGVWVGSLDGQPFKLITRLRPNCSDGMSDRSYPMEAILTVRGEERRGCASPN